MYIALKEEKGLKENIVNKNNILRSDHIFVGALQQPLEQQQQLR